MKKAGKAAAVILSAAMALSAASVTSVGASAEWVETDEGFCYTDNYTGERLTGWQTIGNGEYYFDGKWHVLGKRKYYFDKNGIALTGWQEIDGNTYFFNGAKKGRMVTSWAGGAKGRYYFGDDGVMRRGWKLIGEDIYFFGDDGIMRTGEQTVGDGVYTFDGEGRLTDPEVGEITPNHILQGIEFGMTKEEVKENSILDLYETSNHRFYFTTPLSKGYLWFDEDGRLEDIEIFLTRSDAQKRFTDMGWKLSDTITEPYPHFTAYYDLYMSEDSSMGAIISHTSGDTYANVSISSGDETERRWRLYP